jgi:hypothetical protein
MSFYDYVDPDPLFTFKVNTPWNVRSMVSKVGSSGSRFSVTIPHKVME